MTNSVRHVIVLLCASLIFIGSSGCEDSDARQRDSVQKSLDAISNELQSALAAAAPIRTGAMAVQAGDTNADLARVQELYEKAKQNLNGIVGKLSSVSGGDPGQQAAKSLLSASALRELANLNMSRVGAVQSLQRRQRSAINEMIDAILQLEATATGVESAANQAQRQGLQNELKSVRSRTEQLMAAASKFDAPIAERTTQISSNQKEVEALRQEVGNLRKKANDLGHADGFATFKQSVATRREADRIEFDMAQREIELEYELTPEHTLASSQVEQLKVLMQSIEQAQAQFDAISQAATGDVHSTRQSIAEFAKQVNDILETMAKQSTEILKPASDDAVAALDKANTQIDSATRGASAEDASAARLEKAANHETKGRLFWSLGRGLTDQQTMLERLSMTQGAAAQFPNLAEELKVTETARSEALMQAKTEYTAAQDLLSQVNSRANQPAVDAFKQSVDGATDALNGKIMASAKESKTTESPSSSDGSASFTPREPGSFASADDLFNYLKSLPKNAAGMRASRDVTRAETDEGKHVLKVSQDFAEAMAALDDAMRAKFKKGILDMPGMAAGGSMPDLSNATIAEQTDDRVVYSLPVMGKSVRFVLRQVDGSWWVDADDMDEQTKAMMAMQEQTAGPMIQALKGLTVRVEKGEFKSAQDVFMAFGQAMMSAAGGAGMPKPGAGN